MKSFKIVYWVFTSLFAAMMVAGGIAYLRKAPEVMEGLKISGFPYYFMQLLGVAKILGSIMLFYSFNCKTLKEWAYSGFYFTLIGAIWVHIKIGISVLSPVIALIILSVTYYLWYRIRKEGGIKN